MEEKMKTILHINNDNFEELVKNSKGKLLLDFYATWCGPCKMLSPIVEQVNEECEEITVAKLDIDEGLAIAKQFGIMSVPTIILFVDGEEKDRMVGLRQKAQILEAIKNV